jgi:hypothetical protein
MKNKNFLRRYSNSVDLLQISTNANDMKIVSAEGVEKNRIAEGFFESEGREKITSITALMATPNGPLLILNFARYYPKLEKTKIEVDDCGKLSQFLVFDGGEILFQLFYEEKVGIGSNPYDQNRDDVDFYCWLSKNAKNPKFYDYYCKER